MCEARTYVSYGSVHRGDDKSPDMVIQITLTLLLVDSEGRCLSGILTVFTEAKCASSVGRIPPTCVPLLKSAVPQRYDGADRRFCTTPCVALTFQVSLSSCLVADDLASLWYWQLMHDSSGILWLICGLE